MVRAVNRRIVSGDDLDEPTRVDAGDVLAMLVHAALLNRVPRRAAAAALKFIAAAIAVSDEDSREVMLATLDDARHVQPIF